VINRAVKGLELFAANGDEMTTKSKEVIIIHKAYFLSGKNNVPVLLWIYEREDLPINYGYGGQIWMLHPEKDENWFATSDGAKIKKVVMREKDLPTGNSAFAFMVNQVNNFANLPLNMRKERCLSAEIWQNTVWEVETETMSIPNLCIKLKMPIKFLGYRLGEKAELL